MVSATCSMTERVRSAPTISALTCYQIPNSLLTLGDLTANDIATLVAETVRQNPPPNQIVGGFGSLFLDQPSSSGTNDFLYEASVLPYNGGNVTILGDGQLEGIPGTGVADVDLYRINVSAGSVLEVDTDFAGSTTLGAIVRLFDELGNELQMTVDSAIQYAD